MGNKTKNWNEFRDTGLLVFVNVFLHIFGWAITIDLDDETNKVTSVYPMKVNYSGFRQEIMDNAYDDIKKFIGSNEPEEVYEEPPTKEEKISVLDSNCGVSLDLYMEKIKKYKELRDAQEKQIENESSRY